MVVFVFNGSILLNFPIHADKTVLAQQDRKKKHGKLQLQLEFNTVFDF